MVLGGFSPRLLWDPQGGDRPRTAAVAGGDVRRVGFLPRLFWGWNIPNGAGATGGGPGAGRDPGRGNPGPPQTGQGVVGSPQPLMCFTTHTAPLKILANRD